MIVEVLNKLNVEQVIAPASKSYAQRAILAASLCKNVVSLHNCGKSHDVARILDIAQQLGAVVSTENEKVTINPRKKEPNRILNCGESGLGIRLTTSIAATYGGKFTINGEGSLATRPMDSFLEFLPKLGVQFNSTNGHIPLKIQGVLTAGNIEIDGSMSSQFLSGLLMALPLASDNSTLKVKELVSKPYIDMTLSILEDFGIVIKHDNYSVFQIKGRQEYKSSTDYTIEGDWSGAAFWVVYGAIYKKIAIQGLNKNSLQADMDILKVLKLAGSDYHWLNNELIVKPKNLIPFEFDATNCPDLFPILATFAASIDGISVITGTSRLVHKESNRALAIQKEFSKLGLAIDLEGDNMIIHGNSRLKSATIHSNNDHRIAMACAIASVLTPNGIKIQDAEAVDKSYPEFWKAIEQ